MDATVQKSLLDEPKKPQEEDKIGYKYRKQTVADLLGTLKAETRDPTLKEMVEALELKLTMLCDEVAAYVDDVPRKMNVNNSSLKDVFEQIAESIRDMPDSPRAALQRICNAQYDAQRIPDLSEATRRAGYEEGYRDAGQGQQTFVGDIDIDID